jgi:dGTPase
LTEEAARASAQLVQLLQGRVYRSEEINQARVETSHKVASLFELFMSRPEALPAAYRKRAEHEPLHQVVCEYIAGMTDKFLLRLHEELLG